MEKVIVDGRIYKTVYSPSGLCTGCAFRTIKTANVCAKANEQLESLSCSGKIYEPYDMADLVAEHKEKENEL